MAFKFFQRFESHNTRETVSAGDTLGNGMNLVVVLHLKPVFHVAVEFIGFDQNSGVFNRNSSVNSQFF